jgi:hypothetical protein
METRRLLTRLAAGIGIALLAPLSAQAVPLNVLVVTDLNDNVLTDFQGNPAIRILEESAFPGGNEQVSIEVVVPDIIPISTAGAVLMIEELPDPVTHQARVSDRLDGQLLSSSATAPAFLVVALRGFTPPRPTETCQAIGLFTCTLETGFLQNMTAALFPNHPNLSFRVYVQSDPHPNPPVPEPGTALLMGMGMAGLALLGRRRAV